MKVVELFEIDTWENKPETLDYLYKKQQSLVHHFQLFYAKIMEIHPTDKDLLWSTSTLLNLHAISTRDSKFLIDRFATLPCWKYVNIKSKWDKLLIAKQKYENAGGKYDNR